MIKEILEKAKEATLSVLPLAVIVTIIFSLSFIPNFIQTVDGLNLISTTNYITFIICCAFLIIGFIFFQLGADASLVKAGHYIGSDITKRGKIIILFAIVFFLGLLVAIAEPDLAILGDQLKSSVNPWLFKVIVATGVGIFFCVGLLRILMHKPIKTIFLTGYFVIFCIACFFGPGNDSAFIALSFDASGVATGSATVPFVIAFGASLATTRGGKDANDNSFGVAGIMSIGPIITMLLLSLFIKDNPNVDLSNPVVVSPITDVLTSTLLDVLLGVLPLACFFYIYNFIFLKLPKKELIKLSIGFIYIYIGLYVFVSAATIGFIPLGKALGENIALNKNIWYLFILLPIIIGLVLVIAEPAVHVLTKQVEEISNGLIKKSSMLIALCVGVSGAITLEFIRIVWGNGFSILYYLVPVFIIAILLSFFIEDIYVALAFDSGGIASGTLCVSFILPFLMGTLAQINSSIAGFGVVGVVSVFPIISIECLGVLAKYKYIRLQKITRRRISDGFDLQVIHFRKEDRIPGKEIVHKQNKNKTAKAYDLVNNIENLKLFVIIVDHKQGEFFEKTFTSKDYASTFTMVGHGSAPSEMYDLLGLAENMKDIVLVLVKESNLVDAKTIIEKRFNISQKSKGIAFTIELNSMAGLVAYKFLTKTLGA